MKYTHMVSYDLHRPAQNYDGLIETLKSFYSWWHHLDSTWLVVTSLTAAQLRDRLSAIIDSNDELLVIDVTADSWASWGFTDQANGWLTTNVSGAVRYGR